MPNEDGFELLLENCERIGVLYVDPPAVSLAVDLVDAPIDAPLLGDGAHAHELFFVPFCGYDLEEIAPSETELGSILFQWIC
ncbi:hypothetical protein AEQ27_09655 [Frigoribacterium sp. RIT-PI-h]|nr:hypothetical protein AEQ27_09655 [Frigoribacterium sp. RIT-PI-h]